MLARIEAYAAAAAVRTDTELKRRFIRKAAQLDLNVTSAAEAAGLYPSLVYNWLNIARRRLDDSGLSTLAAWLGISPEEAIKLQGGTVYEHRRDGQRVGSERHNARMRASATYRARVSRRIQKPQVGRAHPQDRRDNISAGLRRHYAQPGAPRPGYDRSDPRGRAQAVLRALRRHHPDWTPDQVRDEAMARVLADASYGVTTRRAAWKLLAPRWKHRPHLNGGPRPIEHRHDILDAIDAEYPRASDGDRTRKAWDEFVCQVEAHPDEGPGSLSRTSAQTWAATHAKHCTRIGWTGYSLQ